MQFLWLLIWAMWCCGAARAEELALLELAINGRATQRVESFALRDGQVFAPRLLWRGLGVVDDLRADGNETVSVAQLKGVQAHLDLEGRQLALELPPDPGALKVLDRGVPVGEPELQHGNGALLNYDLNRAWAAVRSRSSGMLEGRWFSAHGVLEQSTLVFSGPTTQWRRLNTTFTHSDAQRLRRTRIGDFITGGLGWSRPLRMAGLQLITDFALRPGLVTSPTPHLAGSVAVPSTVDVFVDGVRQLSEPVEPGRFEVRQLPVVNGQGDVSVVVRDALGRETVQTLSFYATNRQLARGLAAYAFEVGPVRRGFGSDGDRYRRLAATATWRYGATDATTLEAHGEVSRGTAVTGFGTLTKLGTLGLVDTAVAASLSEGARGALINLNAERRTPAWCLQIDLNLASPGYRDLAAAQGDAPLRRHACVSAGWQLAERASLGFAAIDQRSGPAASSVGAAHTRLVSATYTRSLAAGVQVNASAYCEQLGERTTGDAAPGTKPGYGIGISLSVPFGARGAASAMLTRDRLSTKGSLMAVETAQTTDDLGWRVQDEHVLGGDSGASHQLARLEYLAPAARLGAEVERLGGQTAARLSAQGALLALGGLHAAQWVTDSVAVVDVDGQPGVSVFHQNRLIGRTDASGRIVVPGLLSFQVNKLAIEPLDLPLDAEANDLVRTVQPADRSGLYVRLALQRDRAALVLPRDALGRPLPIGARVRTASGIWATVGHDGQAYVRGLGDDNRIDASWGASRCSVQFAWSERHAETGRVGPLRCE